MRDFLSISYPVRALLGFRDPECSDISTENAGSTCPDCSNLPLDVHTLPLGWLSTSSASGGGWPRASLIVALPKTPESPPSDAANLDDLQKLQGKNAFLSDQELATQREEHRTCKVTGVAFRAVREKRYFYSHS